MSTTYAKSQTAAQKKDASSASSVFDASSQSESLQRKADMANNAAQRAEAPRPNNTGMPDNLKSGIESLSGFSMDDVRVHYNSSKPATVQALAYTQGTDIHVAPGQEKHLPHEAWHVAQQMAGRVSPTTNINGMPVNDNAALEHEADVMGEKAVQCKKEVCCSLKKNNVSKDAVQCEPYPHITDFDESKIVKVLPNPDAEKKSMDSILDPDSKYLPIIAFEVMAGHDRINELIELYCLEIKRYKGRAYVYVGVNVFDEKENTLDQDVKNVIDGIQPFLNYNHCLVVVPFRYSKTVNGTVYIMPYMEARHLLMSQAQLSDATIFRWIDSDVRDDTSIFSINENGYAEFDFFSSYEDCEHGTKIRNSSKCTDLYLNSPLVYSGFYKWRTNGEFEADERVNEHETFLRYAFWSKKGSLWDQICEQGKMPDPYEEGKGYIPEPIAYMTRKAHEMAMENLMKKWKTLPGACQQNEAKFAFVGVPVVFKPTFSVSKPVKRDYVVCVVGDCSKMEDFQGVRQTAFKHWGINPFFCNNVFDRSKKMLHDYPTLVKKVEIPRDTGLTRAKQEAVNEIICFGRKSIRFIYLKKKVDKSDVTTITTISTINELISSACKMIGEIKEPESIMSNGIVESMCLRAIKWIEKICIKAIENGEKESAVKMMNDIVLQNKELCEQAEGKDPLSLENVAGAFVFMENELIFNKQKTDKTTTEKKNGIDNLIKFICSFVDCLLADKSWETEDLLNLLKNIAGTIDVVRSPDVLTMIIPELIRREHFFQEYPETLNLIRGAVEAVVEMCARKILQNGEGIPIEFKVIIDVCRNMLQPLKKKPKSCPNPYLLRMGGDAIDSFRFRRNVVDIVEVLKSCCNPSLCKISNQMAIVEVNSLVTRTFSDEKISPRKINFVKKFLLVRTIDNFQRAQSKPFCVNAFLILLREMLNAVVNIDDKLFDEDYMSDLYTSVAGLLLDRQIFADEGKINIISEMIPSCIGQRNSNAEAMICFADAILDVSPLFPEQKKTVFCLCDLFFKNIKEIKNGELTEAIFNTLRFVLRIIKAHGNCQEINSYIVKNFGLWMEKIKDLKKNVAEEVNNLQETIMSDVGKIIKELKAKQKK